MVYIYVLSLESNKYYVGKTCNPYVRITSHFAGKGSAFTRLYKPCNIEQVICDCSDFDEDKITLEYMNKYGIPNVRGGSFTQLNFDENTTTMIQRMINGATNKCFLCGSDEHFINKCSLYKTINNETKNNNNMNNGTYYIYPIITIFILIQYMLFIYYNILLESCNYE